MVADAVDADLLELSTTAYGEASACLKRYDYHQNQGLIPKPNAVKRALRLGIWVHACLEAHEKGRDWRTALVRLIRQAEGFQLPDDDIRSITEQTVDILLGYFDYWGAQPGEQWEPVTAEEEIRFEVAGVVRLKATVDLIVRYRGGLWLVENKSTTSIPDANWRAVDPQTALQFVVCEASGRYKLDGIIFNYLVTRPASVPRVRNDGRLYANTGETTSRAFWQCASEVREKWKPEKDQSARDAKLECERYLEAQAEALISDGRYYQRYQVWRPQDMILETIEDVAAWVRIIQQARKTGRWPRSQHIIVCSRFCPYGPLCQTEYINGRVSEVTREELYQLDDGSREGRLDWEHE